MHLPLRKHSTQKNPIISIENSSLLAPELLKITLDQQKLERLLKLINPDKIFPFRIEFRGGFYYSRFPLIPDKWFARKVEHVIEQQTKSRAESFFRKNCLGYFRAMGHNITLFVDVIAIEAIFANTEVNIQTNDKTISIAQKDANTDKIKSVLSDTLLEELHHSQQNQDDLKYHQTSLRFFLLFISLFMFYGNFILSYAYPTLKNYQDYLFYGVIIVSVFFVLATIGKFFPIIDELMYDSDPLEKEAKFLKQNPTLQKLTNELINIKLLVPERKLDYLAKRLAVKQIKNKEIEKMITQSIEEQQQQNDRNGK